MPSIKVKPAAGLVIRDPISNDNLPVDGRIVEVSDYWTRRLRDGDVINVLIDAPVPGVTLVYGAALGLTSGAWSNAPFLCRLRITGTGTLSIDSRDRAGNVSSAVFSQAYVGVSGEIAFPFFGNAAVQILPTFPSTMTVEVL